MKNLVVDKLDFEIKIKNIFLCIIETVDCNFVDYKTYFFITYFSMFYMKYLEEKDMSKTFEILFSCIFKL